MRPLAVILPALLSLALAKAPLTTRDDTEVVPHNYIVMLKPELSAAQAKDYINSMSFSSLKSQMDEGFQGMVRPFGENLDGINAFHVECDDQTLDEIREDPSVRAPAVSTQRKITSDLVPRID
jgi:hypothetical protein